MATARVSKPWLWNFWWVATISGISATHVVQLVAQKFTKVTLPLRSAVVCLLPSSSTKVDCGAAVWPAPEYTHAPMPAAAAITTPAIQCLLAIATIVPKVAPEGLHACRAPPFDARQGQKFGARTGRAMPIMPA